METLLIVGCGDIARRALPQLQRRYRVSALVRVREPALEAAGVELVIGNLDRPETLSCLPGAGRIAHLAPPAENGQGDLRTRALLDALDDAAKRGEMLPQRFAYISTSGVYGDCPGARVDETRAFRPQTDRARRRFYPTVDAGVRHLAPAA